MRPARSQSRLRDRRRKQHRRPAVRLLLIAAAASLMLAGCGALREDEAFRPSPPTSSRRSRSRIGSRTVARSSTSATRRSIRSLPRTSPISRASGASISSPRRMRSTRARLSRSSTMGSPICRRAPATSSRWTSRAARRSGSTKATSEDEISTVCCGWTSRGVAIGDGRVYLGKLDGKLVALDASSGEEVWSAAVGDWRNGETITSAPLYYDGLVVTGLSGGEFGVRGSVTAYDAETGKQAWRFYTIPGPGRDRPRDVAAGQRRLEARRRPGLADAGSRSGARTALLLDRQHRARLRRQQSQGRQPVRELDRRRSTPRRANTGGTSSRCTTTSGTSTRPRRSCSST